MALYRKNKTIPKSNTLPVKASFTNKNNDTFSGFTLIELLVVISIIGLLASVVLVALNGARAKSRDAKRLADVRQVATAMELFFNDKSSYPTTTLVAVNTYGVFSGSAAACTPGTAGCVNSLAPNYLSKIPVAPTPADSTVCGSSFLGDIANSYQYAGTGSGVNYVNNYTITFCLGGNTGSYSAGLHTLTAAGIQ